MITRSQPSHKEQIFMCISAHGPAPGISTNDGPWVKKATGVAPVAMDIRKAETM